MMLPKLPSLDDFQEEAPDVMAKKNIKKNLIAKSPSRPVQGLAMWSYTGNGFTLMNSILRSGFGSGQAKRWKDYGVEQTAGALVNSSLYAVLNSAEQKPVSVEKTYRGVVFDKGIWEALKEGEIVTFDGLISSTRKKSVAGDFGETESIGGDYEKIDVDTGMKGVITFHKPMGLDLTVNQEGWGIGDAFNSYFGSIGKVNEEEVTLAHHSSFKITSSKPVKDQEEGWLWEMEVSNVEEHAEKLESLLAPEAIIQHVADTSPNTRGHDYLNEDPLNTNVAMTAKAKDEQSVQWLRSQINGESEF